ncbi:MAG: RNA polymerase sigma factor [Gammaproteobacteria bacterium]
MQVASQKTVPADTPVFPDLGRLVDAMRRGEQPALEQLYDATVGKVYAMAAAILRNPADAEEVVCDTYSQAWSTASKFDSSRANVLGWLLMMCRSRALDRLRRVRSAGRGAVGIAAIEDREDEAKRPDDLLALVQQGTRVHAALAALSPERRRLVSMAFLQGLSHQEIAEQTGLPLGTVKSHVRRALAELREQLEQ